MSRRLLFGLLFLVVAVRAVAMARTGVISTDGVNFSYMAQEIAAGRWAEALAQDQHPLYPALLSLFRLPGVPGFSLVLVSLASAGALAFLLLRIAARTLGSEAAAWAVFGFALHPLFVANSADFLSETPSLVLIAGGWLVLARWLERPTLLGEILLGALAGLGYLVRQEAMELLLGVGVLLSWQVAAGRMSFWKAARLLTVCGVAFGVVVSPYLAYLRADEGHWMISRKKGFFALFPWLDPDYSAHPPASQLGMIDLPLAVQVWIHRWPFWKTFADKLAGAFHPWVLLLAVVGGWRFAPAALSRRVPLLGVFFWTHVAVVLVQLNGAGYLEKRHLLLGVLSALPWAGAALARLSAVDRKRRAILAAMTGMVLSHGTLWSVAWDRDLPVWNRLRSARLHPLPARRADYEGRGVYQRIGREIALRADPRGGISCPRTREGQWIAYYAADRRPFFLYDPKGTRLPLTREILARSGAVLAPPWAQDEYADLLAGWERVPTPESFQRVAAPVRDWVLYLRPSER